ncbi:PAS domain-containing protein [Colwellia sp. MEBiC06753]
MIKDHENALHFVTISTVISEEHQDLNWLFLTLSDAEHVLHEESLPSERAMGFAPLEEIYWEWDVASDLIYYSPELMQLLGYKKQAITAPRTFWRKHIASGFLNDLKQRTIQLFKGEISSYNHTFKVVKCDKETLWVNAVARVERDQQGAPTRLYGVLRNVTESKMLIQQLKKQNGYLSLAERISHSGHWRYDIKEEKTYWSTELYRLFGVDTNQFLPSIDNVMSFYPPNEHESIKQNFFESLQHGQSYYNKSTIKLPNGSKRKIETIGEIELDANGQVSAMFGVCRDITDTETTLEKLKLLALVNRTIKVPIFFIDDEDNVVFQDLSPQKKDQNTTLFNFINFSISEYLTLKKEARQHGQIKRNHASFDNFNSVFDFSVTYEADEGIYIWIVDNVTEKFRAEQQ